MPFYKVSFRYVDSKGRTKRGSTELDASSKQDALKRVVRGERKYFKRTVAVDTVKRWNVAERKYK